MGPTSARHSLSSDRLASDRLSSRPILVPPVLSPAGTDESLEFVRRLSSLHRHVVHHHVRKGTRLIVEDDESTHLYVLARGWSIKYKSSVDGRRQIVDFALPGEVLGFISPRRAPYAVDMLTDGEVVAVPRCIFDGLVSADAWLAIQVCRRLEAAEMRAYDRIASIGHRSARLRVARLLLELIDRLGHGGVAGEPPGLSLPLKQQHIGDALALRVETVCRVMVQLRQAGIAVLKRGRLHVLDLQALIAESEATEDGEPDLVARVQRLAGRQPGPAPLHLMGGDD